MYKLVVINQFGESSVLKSDDLERLKVVAKRMNKNGCSVEITKEVVVYRVISLDK